MLSHLSIIICNLLLCVYAQPETQFSQMLDEIFSADTQYYTRSDIVSKNEQSVICWIETMNLINYNNGTQIKEREFSVIFETSKELKNNTTMNNFNLTTKFSAENFTIHINKSVVCGSGPLLTKIFTQWGSKKRLQINIASNKMPDRYNYSYTATTPSEEHDNSLTSIQASPFNQTLGEGHETKRVKKQTNATNDNKIIQNYKAIITIKIYECFTNKTNGKSEIALLQEHERKLKFNANKEDTLGKQLVNDQEIKQSWNKFSKLLANKFYNEVTHPN